MPQVNDINVLNVVNNRLSVFQSNLRKGDEFEIKQEFEPQNNFPTSTQTPVCSYWEAGDCAKGEHCRFLHDPTV